MTGALCEVRVFFRLPGRPSIAFFCSGVCMVMWEKKISAFEINSVAPVNAIPEIPKSQEYTTYILHIYYIYTLHAERWYAKKNVQLAPLAPLGPIGRQ